MSLKYKNNGTTSGKLTAVVFNNGTPTDLNEIIKDGSYIWCKPFTYTRGTLPTGISSLTCYRISSNEPDATVGEVPDGGTVYYGDKLKFTATFEDGYVVEDYQYSSSGDSDYTVTGDVTAVAVTQVHTGGRLTWSLTVKKRENMASVSYKKNNESAVNVTSDVTLTLDYADTVVVSGVAQSEAPYNYTNMVGTGTYTYSTSAQTARVSVTRSVKSYTLTISASGTGYLSSYSVTRTSSPYAGAATGSLSNGATIYYGDKLSTSASAAATRYGGWDCSSSDIPAPTGVYNNGIPSPEITLTAQTSVGANIYHRYGGGDWVHLGWIDGNSSFTDSGLSYNTSYEYILGRNQSRSYWTRSASASLSSNYTSNNEVRGNVTATFTGSESSAQTQTQWINGTTNTISTGDVPYWILYITVDNGQYGSCGVTRTSSPLKGAATGALSNGDRIYYKDVLSGWATPNGQSGSTVTSYGSVANPTITYDANKGWIVVTNNHGSTVNMYYSSTGNSYTSTSVGSGSTYDVKDYTEPNHTYYAYAKATVYDTSVYYTYYVANSYSGTGSEGVSGIVYAYFNFGATEHRTNSPRTAQSSTVSVTTPNYTKCIKPSVSIVNWGTFRITNGYSRSNQQCSFEWEASGSDTNGDGDNDYGSGTVAGGSSYTVGVQMNIDYNAWEEFEVNARERRTGSTQWFWSDWTGAYWSL